VRDLFRYHINSISIYSLLVLNVFFTRSLADIMVDTPVIVNCVNPGYCYSALRRTFQGFQAVMDWAMEKALARTSEQGGRQLTYAAVGSPGDPDSLRGQYISLHNVEEPSDYVLGFEGKKRQDILWVSR
jgi:NAD(P)-dependent dehydrogenase (short-subunit alcohol dehydrogenase family)